MTNPSAASSRTRTSGGSPQMDVHSPIFARAMGLVGSAMEAPACRQVRVPGPGARRRDALDQAHPRGVRFTLVAGQEYDEPRRVAVVPVDLADLRLVVRAVLQLGLD